MKVVFGLFLGIIIIVLSIVQGASRKEPEVKKPVAQKVAQEAALAAMEKTCKETSPVLYRELVHRVEGSSVYVKPVWYGMRLNEKEGVGFCLSTGSITRIRDAHTGRQLAVIHNRTQYVNQED